ncbi:alkane 1-monooxygenase [Mumia flava]|uniref:Alkane 1-monooxygenase n=1 Tax=Mumia flava TaxID=1348852 RepID=A0A2M9BIH5_9ACTN|nr:fatty acid desaturase [Mumia flava]PJJ57751.1 alkane 1-monooxygenase [Mumia flava]
MADDAPDRIANSTVPAASTEVWKDKKRYLWLIGLVVPSLAFVAAAAYIVTGWGLWLWIGPIIILGVVPTIDLMAGLDRSNPPDDAIEALEKDKYYRWITYAFLPIQYLGFLGAFWVVGGGNPAAWMVDQAGLQEWASGLPFGERMTGDLDLSVLDKVGLAISIGAIGGIGINTAHELGHKREANERWLSKIALAQSFYGHFYIEHNRGHHVRVATPEDPASARLGENFYQFWPRTVIGSLRSAWGLEKRRIARRGKHPFRISNNVLNAWLMSVVLFGTVIALFGWGVTPYLIIQAVMGLTLLEVVNYMEHYGMLRQKVGAGSRRRYERVDPSHSWNSNNIATNVLLYHLQRHSDHHANPTRRYQTLRDFEESPVLPTGYAGMIVLALVPPVWRRVMDPRVAAHFGGDLTRANISPRKRARILAQVGATDAEVARSARTQRGGADGSGVSAVPEVLAARCPGCGYTYEVAAGNEHEGFAAGTAWDDVPNTWCCPDCGVREKVDFVPVDPAEDPVDTRRA